MVILMGERLTKEDVKKIESEIEHRKLVIRPEAIAAVREARAHGDLSENFEYYAAKKDKNKNESRIRYLERMLKTAQIVNDESADNEVGINNYITVEFTDDSSTESFKLVTSVRGDSMINNISIESPIGKAVIGHKLDEIVTVNVNSNVSYTVKIIKIDKNTDESSDTIRTY